MRQIPIFKRKILKHVKKYVDKLRKMTYFCAIQITGGYSFTHNRMPMLDGRPFKEGWRFRLRKEG